MKRISLIILTLVALSFSACTENQRARSFGGTADINLPANQKLVIATWKESELWYLTRPMRADEQPETSTFQEKSSFGMIEGTVVFRESR